MVKRLELLKSAASSQVTEDSEAGKLQAENTKLAYRIGIMKRVSISLIKLPFLEITNSIYYYDS